MSKLVVSRYQVPTEEERRATLQKIALVRQMLQRCLTLREALERFERVEGEELRETLARYNRAVEAQRWDEFVDDYNRLYDSLPALEKQLEQQFAAAKGRRLRLEMTALTLAGGASGDDKAALETMARAAKTMRSESLDAAGVKIEAVLARRLEAQPSEAANAATTAQSELARSLMHPDAPPVEHVSGRDRQAVEAATAARADGERIDRLIAQLAVLD